MKKAILAVAMVVLAAWVLFPTLGFSTAEFAKKESKPCTVCHTKPIKGDENLNEVGKCYKEKKDFAVCEKK